MGEEKHSLNYFPPSISYIIYTFTPARQTQQRNQFFPQVLL